MVRLLVCFQIDIFRDQSEAFNNDTRYKVRNPSLSFMNMSIFFTLEYLLSILIHGFGWHTH